MGRGRDENLAHPKYKALSPARETKKSKENVTTETEVRNLNRRLPTPNLVP